MICIAVISQMIAILYILEKTLRRFFLFSTLMGVNG